VFFFAGESLPFFDKEMGFLFFPSVNSINFANFFGVQFHQVFNIKKNKK
jgi:hypothetical protein